MPSFHCEAGSRGRWEVHDRAGDPWLAAVLTGAAARLAAAALLLMAVGTAIGAAIAAAGGVIAGAVLVGLLEAVGYFGGARLGLVRTGRPPGRRGRTAWPLPPGP